MNRNEQQMYSDITSIRKSLEKIANVLEHMNHDSYLAKQEIPKFQDIPGFEGTLDALDNLCNVKEDKYTYDNDLNEYKYVSKVGKIKNDSDFDIRVAAKQYEDEFLANGHTKKECILHYVTEDFGSKGARYTDIIKFAYYLGAHNAYKFNPTDNRGYYACALTHGRWNTGHLVTGGSDQLVKGINEDGKERYFALSFVDNVTDYYKRLDQ